MRAKAFIDSNVVLYLLSGDAHKACQAEALLAARPVVSVQVLNEVAHVCRRKLRMDWREVDELLLAVQDLCTVTPLTLAVHERGRALARQHQLSVYDAMIAAAALQAGCGTLYSEDMHAGLMLGGPAGAMRIVNPFAPLL